VREGWAEVYRARDARLGRDVAIKVLPADLSADPERLKRFEREARATAALTHPNILAVHDVGSHEGVPYLVEELLEGESLRERLMRGAIPLPEAVEVAAQIARGLAAAHEKHIVHRDLKPGNVFLTKEGTVKILDFGLAKLVEGAPDDEAETLSHAPSRTTEFGRVLGTTAYMAPEQARGMPVDPRADIFAFGVVLYEMLSGKHPFLRKTTADTLSAILHEDPPDLSETNRSVPGALEDIVRHCLEKDPASRLQSARDVVFAIEALPDVSSAKPVAPMSPAGLWFHRRRKALTGAALAVVLAGIGALIVSQRQTAGSKNVPTVLALPCKVYGAPEAEYLTDAVPGTISTLLSQVDGIETKVPPSSFEVEKVKGDLKRLADLYQVSSFIVTSITTSPGKFALNVQLVDAATRKVKWGRQFEGPREAYNDLARQAADGIRLMVRPAAQPVSISPVSSDAELALREGDYFLYRYSYVQNPQDREAALAAYRRTLERDPSHAVAMARIGMVSFVDFQFKGEASGALGESESWVRRALEIDRRCGPAWAMMSGFEAQTKKKHDFERQLEYALKAASFSPREAISHLVVSNAVTSPGAASLRIAAALAALRVDPFLLGASGNAVCYLSALGRPTEAIPFADRAVQLAPEAGTSLVMKGFMLLKLGRLEEAQTILGRWEPRFLEHPDAIASQIWGQVRFQVAAVKKDVATIEKLERSIVPPLLDGRADAFTLGLGTASVSPALARLGRTDESIRILLRSVDAGIPPPYDYLLYEPDFRPLRGDPRFARVLAASRDGAAKIARILGEARSRGELPKYLEAPLDDLLRLLNEKGSRS
jgi:tetratricopeptide (TPR) repeat protein